MLKTAIVADTNSGLTLAQAQALGVHLLSMPFLIDSISYFEGVDCTPAQFFQRLAAGAEVVTSQPSPDSILSLWNHLLEDHDAILHFPMSSELSGSCQTARALAGEYPGRVYVVDNRRISVTLLQSVLEAKRLLEQGMAPEEVQATLERESLDASIYIAVNTLKYLKKSGRVTAAGAAMATVLNLKPVLQIQGGKLDAFKKVRGMQQAGEVMLEAMAQDLKTRLSHMETALYAVYSGREGDGRAWLREVQGAFPTFDVQFSALPLSICCHVGDGALAIACVRK